MNVAKMMKDLQRDAGEAARGHPGPRDEATAGGGVVTARMNGRKYLTAIRLAPEAITPEDPGLMQDLILAAVNEASRKVDAEIERMTQGMAGGLKIPGLT